MTYKKIILEALKKEAGKKQIDIAQAYELVGILAEKMAKDPEVVKAILDLGFKRLKKAEKK